MTRRRRLGNAFTTDEAIDTTLLVSPLLTAWTRVATAGRTLPFASSAAATVASVGAAIGVFASLALKHGSTIGRLHHGALES